MSSYGSLAGAQMVADQIFFEGLAAQRRHDANLHQLAADSAQLRWAYDDLVGRYNEIVHLFNELRQRAIEIASESDQKSETIARLEIENARMAAELERLRLDLRDVTTHRDLLRELNRQNNPDAYPLG